MKPTIPHGVRAVLFDVFGTLLEISSPKRPFGQLLRIARLQGVRLPANVKSEMMSTPMTLRQAAGWLGVQASTESLHALERDLAEELDSIRAFPDALEVLRVLRGRGYTLAVCSNLAAPYVEPASNLLAPYIDVAIWSCHMGWMKPEPEIYLLAVEKLGLPADEVLMVGDTYRNDVAGARAVGLQARLLDRRGREGDPADCWSTLDALISSEPGNPLAS